MGSAGDTFGCRRRSAGGMTPTCLWSLTWEPGRGVRLSILKGSVSLLPAADLHGLYGILHSMFAWHKVFVRRGSALQWTNAERWTRGHIQTFFTTSSSLLPALHRFFFSLSQLYFCMTEGGCENMERASWGVNLTLPLVQCCTCTACDRLVLLLGFILFHPVQGTDMQTVQKLKLQPKHITVHNLWLLNQNGKGSGSASSNCCLYKKSLWLCLTELWLCLFNTVFLLQLYD